jgi:hypothetical protein
MPSLPIRLKEGQKLLLAQKEIIEKIDLSFAPWTMHEFFAGSELVAYGHPRDVSAYLYT